MAIGGQKAFDEIQTFIRQRGKPYHAWYVGITDDPQRRLLEHSVDPDGIYKWARCTSSEIARSVEEALLNLGCDGGPGGGDDLSDYVYAYLKTDSTNP